MESLKITPTTIYITLVFAMSLTGCVANQAEIEGGVEKPPELVKALKEFRNNGDPGELPTGDAFELSSLADEAYDREDWALAEKYYRRLINQVPTDAYGYFRLGNVLMQFARVDNAINAYNQAIKRDPNHIRALKNRSLAYLLSAELNLEGTVKILKSQNDSASASYQTALQNLQRLNGLPLNEAISPVQGLYLDHTETHEDAFDASDL